MRQLFCLIVSIGLFGTSAYGMLVSEPVVWMALRAPISAQDRETLPWLSRYPHMLVVANPDNPKQEVGIPAFGMRLCGITKGALTRMTGKQLIPGTTPGLACSALLPLIPDAGLSVEDGMLTVVFYAEITEGHSVTEDAKTFAYRFGKPILLRLPIRGDRIKDHVDSAHSKLKSRMITQWRSMWEHMLHLRGDAFASDETVWEMIQTQIGNGDATASALMRQQLVYRYVSGIDALRFAYRMSVLSTGEKISDELEEALYDAIQTKHSVHRRILTKMRDEVSQWNDATLPGRLFTPAAFSQLGFGDFEKCTIPEWRTNTSKTVRLWGDRVVWPWLCVMATAVDKLAKHDFETWEKKDQEVLLRMLHSPVLEWAEAQLKTAQAHQALVRSVRVHLSDHMMGEVVSDVARVEQNLRHQWQQYLWQQEFLKALSNREQTQTDLRSLVRDPMWVQGLTADQLVTFSDTADSDASEGRQIRRLFHAVHESVLHHIRDMLARDWSRSDAWEETVDPVIPKALSLPDGNVPKIFSLLRQRVLSFVYQVLRVMEMPTDAHRDFVNRFLRAEQIMQWLFLARELPSDLGSHWVWQEEKDTGERRISLPQEKWQSAWKQLLTETDPVIKNTSPPKHRSLDQMTRGLRQIEWLLFLYRRLGVQDNVVPPFVYRAELGPLEVRRLKTQVVTAQKQTLRPFERVRLGIDPYQTLTQVPWQRLDRVWEQVRRCDVTQSDTHLCVEWRPDAFMYPADASAATSWEASPWGMPGKVASVRVEQLTGDAYAAERKTTTELAQQLQPGINEWTWLAWKNVQRADMLHPLPKTISQVLAAQFLDMPYIYRVRSHSFSRDGSKVAQVSQIFVLYFTLPNNQWLKEPFELKMLTRQEIHILPASGGTPLYTYASALQPFHYPHLFGFRVWKEGVDAFMRHLVTGFANASFQPDAYVTQQMSGELKPFQFAETQLHHSNTEKWLPFSHHHEWMTDAKVALLIGGCLFVIDREQGMIYRSDNFDAMGSRLLGTPVSSVSPDAPLLAWDDYWKSRMVRPFSWFYHLPLGPGVGVLPPHFGYRDVRYEKSNHVLDIDLADYMPPPKLEMLSEIAMLVVKHNDGDIPKAGRFGTAFPQIKMVPTLPMTMPFVSETHTFWDVLYRMYGHMQGVTEHYRMFGLFHNRGVELAFGPSGKFVWVHTPAAPDRMHETPNSMFMPRRSYISYVPVTVLQAAPQLVQLSGWHDMGWEPFVIQRGDSEAIEKEWQCVDIPYCRYNAAILSMAVDDAFAVMATMADSPAQRHLEIRTNLASDNRKPVWGSERKYAEQFGSLSERVREDLWVVGGLDTTSGHMDKAQVHRITVGNGIRGQTLFGKEVLVPWMHSVTALAISRGIP